MEMGNLRWRINMKLKTEFQDEDFRKGEVADVSIATIPDGRIVARAKAKSGGEHTFYYDSLETLYNDWTDYEEPKEYWIIDMDGEVKRYALHSFNSQIVEDIKSIGNYFLSREEAERAAEKLKAWKRLKDKGFEITDWAVANGNELRFFGHYIRAGIKDELDLLFGGEE